MALNSKDPSCSNCTSKESEMWHTNEENEILCANCNKKLESNDNDCKPPTCNTNEDDFKKLELKEDFSNEKKEEDDPENYLKEKETQKLEKKEAKRRTRKGKSTSKGNFLKGKGRRIIFKKSVSLYFIVRII